ncbi:hypothetical protein H2248_008575 [Termitomyces sp. 'cryptogamus']|nr:hypothetical protein H2248_008575 [Termitomyces sp. 'cryptogamus']
MIESGSKQNNKRFTEILLRTAVFQILELDTLRVGNKIRRTPRLGENLVGNHEYTSRWVNHAAEYLDHFITCTSLRPYRRRASVPRPQHVPPPACLLQLLTECHGRLVVYLGIQPSDPKPMMFWQLCRLMSASLSAASDSIVSRTSSMSSTTGHGASPSSRVLKEAKTEYTDEVRQGRGMDLIALL